MDGLQRHILKLAQPIDRTAQGIKHPPLRTVSCRHRDLPTGVQDRQAASQADRGTHNDPPNSRLIQVLMDFDDPIPLPALDQQCPKHRRQLTAREADVYDRADNTTDPTLVHRNVYQK